MIDRLGRARQILMDRGLDGLIITHPSNRFYLSGYSGQDIPPDESAGVLLLDAESATLLTGATNVDWARAEAKGFVVEPWQRPWSGTVAEAIQRRRWSRVGFEESAMLVATHQGLRQALRDVELVPLGDAVDRLRLIKEPAEQAALADAIRLTDEVFNAAVAGLAAGVTERDLAWRIEREMRERGADGPAFPTIVAAGPHAARPHHAPTDRPIEPGEPVIIDLGARLNGYNGDLTRTVWVGEPSARLRDIYAVVDRAQRAALATVRAGIPGKAVDAAAREVIEAAGYGDYFSHGLGHGLGIRVHESPSANKTADDPLPAGSVITVEPGIYLPDWGGVRIEDVGIVEDGGFRVLTTAPKAAPRA